MAETIVRDAVLWFDGYDLSGDMNALAVSHSANLQENSTLGDTFVTRLAGIKVASINHEGYWNDTPDEQFFNKIGSSNAVMSMSPESGADGEIGYIMQAAMAEYSPGGGFDEMFAFSVSGESDGELVRGTIMAVETTASSGNGTTRQLGAVSATQKLYATIHCLTAAGTTLDVIIQSDDNSGMTSAVTRGTFAQLTAIGAEWLTPVDGAITDDYWRVNYTISGGSFTFIVVIGIR